MYFKGYLSVTSISLVSNTTAVSFTSGAVDEILTTPAARICTLTMYAGIQGDPNRQHTKYVAVNSNVDLTNLYNQGKAAIFYQDERGGTVGFTKNSWMKPWTLNKWGVSTFWTRFNPKWRESWRWKINYVCG